jgi:hypothetical protein
MSLRHNWMIQVRNEHLSIIWIVMYFKLVPDGNNCFIPSVAYAFSNGTWKVELRGWPYHPIIRGIRCYSFDRCLTGLINARGEWISMQYHIERLTHFLVEDLPIDFEKKA